MIETSRRNFLGLLAAPAILRVAKPMALWMPPKPKFTPLPPGEYNLYDKDFAEAGLRIGQTLRIRIPNGIWREYIVEEVSSTRNQLNALS